MSSPGVANKFNTGSRSALRFSVRTLLVFMAISCGAIAYLHPYFNDSRFAKSLDKFHGEPVNQIVEYLNENGRSFGTQWSSNRQLIGLTINLLDGRQYEIGVDEHGPISETFSLDFAMLENCKAVRSNPEVVGGFVKY